MNVIAEVCKIGQGEACCKYLLMFSKGWECGKVTPTSKKLIDDSWSNTSHVAKGDNCEGNKFLKEDMDKFYQQKKQQGYEQGHSRSV